MRKKVFVGGDLAGAAKRVAATWNRAERGEKVAPQDNVTFVSWSALASVMTDKRHELLRHLHRHPAPSVSALARDLRRDYKRVHEDVAALARIGLVEKKDDKLRADYAEIRAVIAIEA